MNINFTQDAHAAINAASNDVKLAAFELKNSYAQYKNAHSPRGKSTLKNISAAARQILGLPKGTRVFICG